MATNGYVIIIDMIPPPAPVRCSTGQNEILSFQDITKLPESACAILSDMALVCKKESKKKKEKKRMQERKEMNGYWGELNISKGSHPYIAD